MQEVTRFGAQASQVMTTGHQRCELKRRLVSSGGLTLLDGLGEPWPDQP
jgi:hypothetical protein